MTFRLRLHSVAAATAAAAAAAATQYQAAESSLAARGLEPESPGDGDLKLHEATFLASHNAHAALAVAEGMLEPLGANQDDAILHQLAADGVRGLLLDVVLDFEGHADEPLRLVHGSSSFLLLDYGGFGSVLGSDVVPFLEADEGAIVSLFLEAKGDFGEGATATRAAISDHLKQIFSSVAVNGVSLKDMTFKYNHDLWKEHEDWPKLDEIRRSGQRMFVFADWSEFANEEYGFMFNRQVLQENGWEGIDACEARYMWRSAKVSLPSNDYWTRLFFMNHFCCGSGPGAKGNTIGQNLIGGGNNGWGSLYPRIQQCMRNNGGFKPNFIALDWVAQSEEAREIRDYLNFGGRLGTGQTCTDDSHCATRSCNVAQGVCQCRRCRPDGTDVCPGCVSGQHCSPPGGAGGVEVNVCEGNGGGSSSQSLNDTNPQTQNESEAGAVNIATHHPHTQNQTEAGTVAVATNRYCREEYSGKAPSCDVAVKCPGGDEDCPDGQACFEYVDCTPAVKAAAATTHLCGLAKIGIALFSLLWFS